MKKQQTKKTDNNIKTALLQLLEEKELSAISAKEIMEKAGGTRSNFYNHYRDKYDLRNAIVNDEIEAMQAIINGFFHEHDEIKSWQDIYDLNYERYAHVCAERELYHALFTKSCFAGFPAQLRETLAASLSYHFQNYYRKYLEFIRKNNSFYTYIMAAAFVDSLEYWVRNDFNMSVKLITDYFTRGFFQDPSGKPFDLRDPD